MLAVETLDRHARGFGLANDDLLPVGGVYAWRREGEHHMWNPETIALLQHSVRHGGQPTYDEYAKLVNEDAARRATLRGLLKFRELPEDRVAGHSTTSSRRARSSSASSPARCRSARCRARRTRRWRSP